MTPMLLFSAGFGPMRFSRLLLASGLSSWARSFRFSRYGYSKQSAHDTQPCIAADPGQLRWPVGRIQAL